MKLEGQDEENQKMASDFKDTIRNEHKSQQFVSDNYQSEIKTHYQNDKIDKQSHSTYRPDIDGLRAIAITIVVIFHAFPEYMQGGFIGVDVFFVISGYLISQIIIKETLNQKFSYSNFYSRRVKRIYPALILTLLFVIYVVLRYYQISQLKFTLQTLNAAVFFGANFQVLMHEKDYFDPDVHTNPLLHLWSLGVEEQFYIFWPCLITLGLKVFKNRTLLILLLYTAFSFLFGIISVYINPKFAFYFPLCRFWQMSVGGIVAYIGLKFNSKKINNILSFTGVFSILVTVWIINDESLFPGFWALIPTFASACIIQSRNQSFLNKYLLSNKIMVFIGKISYPMYLWHWPLIVFSKYIYPKGSTSIFSNLYFILILVIGLSILTYFIFENPVRRSKSKIIVVILLVIMLGIGADSYFNLKVNLVRNDNFDRTKIVDILQEAEKQYIPRKYEDYVQRNGKMHPNLSKSKNRQPPTIQKTKIPYWTQAWDHLNGGQIILQKRIQQGSKYYIKDRPKLRNYQVANQGKQNQIFIVGDSHAQKIAYRFQQLFYDSVANNKTDSFPTIVAMIRTGFELSNTNYLLKFSLQMMKKHKPKRVLVTSFWTLYVLNNKDIENPIYREEKYDRTLNIFFNYIKEIQSLGIEVSTLALDMNDRNYQPNFMVDFYGIVEENIKPVRLSVFRERYKRLINDLQTNLKKLNVDIIDTTDNLCWQDQCEVLTPTGYAVFVDQNHYGKFFTRHWMSCVDHLVQF